MAPNTRVESRQQLADVLVIGSGAAGLVAALSLASSARVALLSKTSLHSGSTWLAQGGIAAVLGADDSVAAHMADTLSAGSGLCDEQVVQHVVRASAATVRYLARRGVSFTRQSHAGAYHLGREGGHSHRRVAHSDDSTGRALSSSLADLVLAHPNIRCYEHHLAIDLIRTGKEAFSRCSGAFVYDCQSGLVRTLRARAVVLATGGAGRVYLYSSNPDTASGDGIAMAWRAGCRVADMEFVQFHPTCLYHSGTRSFLISEAMRGEGARLLLPDGSAFMHRFSPDLEMAPRDIVARAIDFEMKRLGVAHVLLDISHRSADFIVRNFPNIYKTCAEYGMDICRQPIPVVPAAHYSCGGVVVDTLGRTDLQGLYAIGEVSHTGMHGANRMASNSLLECAVYARAAAAHIRRNLSSMPLPRRPLLWDESRVHPADEAVSTAHNWDELRRCMWDYVGIVRSDLRMARAASRVQRIAEEAQEHYSAYKVGRDSIELRNLATCAMLIVRCAMARKESRGLHYNKDYPESADEALSSLCRPGHRGAVMERIDHRA